VENIVWQRNAPVGEYSVWVNNYSCSNPTVGRKKDFDVAITVGENHKMFTTSMPPEDKRKMKIATFGYDKQGMQMVWGIESK
jgi:hypothetical protein